MSSTVWSDATQLHIALHLGKHSNRAALASKQKHCAALSALSLSANHQKSTENENYIVYI